MSSVFASLFKKLVVGKMGNSLLNILMTRSRLGRGGWQSLLREVSQRRLKPMGAAFSHGTGKNDGMGALLRFLLVNAVSVIGAKLINEAAERASGKLFSGGVKNDTPRAASDAPTLETRTCAKCGAFRVRGEACACGA